MGVWIAISSVTIGSSRLKNCPWRSIRKIIMPPDGSDQNSLREPSVRALPGGFYWRSILHKSSHARILTLFLLLALVVNSRADQFDTLRLYWQSNLVNNGSSLTSVANTANGYWS